MVSRSSRQYIRILGDASPVEPLALHFISFRELVSLLTPTFALEDAIIRICRPSWLLGLVYIQWDAYRVRIIHYWTRGVNVTSSSLSSSGSAACFQTPKPSTLEEVGRRVANVCVNNFCYLTDNTKCYRRERDKENWRQVHCAGT